MLKNVFFSFVTAAIIASSMFLGGCENDAQSGALIGAGAGALIGQAVSHDTKGTLIGAGAGAVGGYVVGNEMEKNKQKSKPAPTPAPSSSASASPDQNTVTVWVNNSNGSQSPVRLSRNSNGTYTGPKGEQYSTLPTEEQLKQAYGF